MASRLPRASAVRELQQLPVPPTPEGDPPATRPEATATAASSGFPYGTGWVLAGYLAVLVLVAWPLVSTLTTRMQGLGDAGSFIWGFWWLRHALETAQNPLSTTMMFAPVGTPLAFHTGMPALAVLSLPLQWAFGPVVAFNLVVLAAPIASAGATYALARDLGQGRVAAFVSGLAFGFAPALIDRLAIEHLNLAFVAWLPLAVWGLRRVLASPSWGRSAVLGATFALAIGTDLTVFIFCLLTCAAYAAGYLWRRRGGGVAGSVAAAARLVRLVAPGALVAALLAAPLLVAMARVVIAGDFPEVPGLGGATDYSADVVSFFVPSPRHRWLGGATQGIYTTLQGRPLDGAASLGFAVLALAALGLGAGWRRPVVRWAALLAGLGVVLALGPQLHILGRTSAPLGFGDSSEGLVSPLLPFTWTQVIPVLEGLRSPVRFLTLAALGLALLAGFGFARLTAGRPPQLTVGLAVVAALAIGAESASAFPTLTSSRMPAVYEVIVRDPGDFIVVDVPLGFRSGVGNVGSQQGPPLVWATRHGRAAATGFGARTPVSRLDALAGQPLYRDLVALQDPLPDPVPPDPREGRGSALALHARYVTVNGTYPAVASYLAEIGYRRVAADGEVVLYRLDS